MIPRGIRNHNPGNLRWKATRRKWVGQAGQDQDGFCIFLDPLYGLRAMAKLLLNYHRRQGLDCVADIITGYAPPTENPTDVYIATVANSLGVDPYDPLPLDEPKTVHRLMEAIIRVECGVQPYKSELIDEALGLAWKP